jgi:uncharacterized protein involved in exopolysaccharide biosynthesis
MNELSPSRIRRLAPPPDEAQPQYPYASHQDEFNLSAYWNVLVKHRRLIVLLALAAFAPGAYFALTATKLYTATAIIKIEPQSPRVTAVDLQPLEFGREYDYHKTQFALLQSRALVARVITGLNLETNKTFTDADIVTPNPIVHLMSWTFRPLRFLLSSVTPLLESGSTTNELYPAQQTAASNKLGPELKVSPGLIDQ